MSILHPVSFAQITSISGKTLTSSASNSSPQIQHPWLDIGRLKAVCMIMSLGFFRSRLNYIDIPWHSMLFQDLTLDTCGKQNVEVRGSPPPLLSFLLPHFSLSTPPWHPLWPSALRTHDPSLRQLPVVVVVVWFYWGQKGFHSGSFDQGSLAYCMNKQMEIHKNPSKLMDAHSPSCNIHTLVFMIGVMRVLLDQVFTTPKSLRRELQPHPIFMSWNLCKLVSNVSRKQEKCHHGVRSSFPSSKSLHTHTYKQTYRHPACASPATPVFPPVMRTVLPLMELGFGSNLNKDKVLIPKNRCFLTAKLDALRL